jgi:hypothetical protein
MHISAKVGLRSLEQSKKLFLELYSHGTLSVEIYRPEKWINNLRIQEMRFI